MSDNDTLVALVHRCPHLKCIDLTESGEDITDSALMVVAVDCHGLEVLVLNNSSAITDDGLLAVVRNCRHLRTVLIKYQSAGSSPTSSPPPTSSQTNEESASGGYMASPSFIQPPATNISGRKWDVFICHGGGDKGIARDLYNNLTGRDLRVFLDIKSLDGERCATPRDMVAHVKASSVVLVLVSKFLIVSRWAMAEAKAAVDAADANRGKVFSAIIGSDITSTTLRNMKEHDVNSIDHPLIHAMDNFFQTDAHHDQWSNWRHEKFTPAHKTDHVATVFRLLEYGFAPFGPSDQPSEIVSEIAKRTRILATGSP
ncbi:uncharacterized protein AMSG_08833 [Thecamonas trahens ATCC 50062]|uniref:TIR domain-containing protein n=1 Tax=Thecamonas trahens ATCC 50062 TaxID=461836 RepID=A0A0L0DLY9_THETB|nr:hypothetical protein AMSG_08833 [Thecamonas trahens ATCC 50062]KNC53334.1 hypothetical protein AMSG_08833 [Thecamonas trahens ATCC 50062]|eukprot:XP_013754589.1 hypothetical protein AMSG_08833 [Thecamonas trahens ATCC 50062]